MKRLDVAAAIVRRGDEILLVRQQTKSADRPYWTLPAGRVEEGEAILSAVERELFEETGIRARAPVRLAYAAQGRSELSGIYWVTFTFEVDHVEGVPAPCDPDGIVMEARFFSMEEAIAKIGEYQPYEVMREPVIRYLSAPDEYLGAFWEFHQKADGTQAITRSLKAR